MNGTLDEDGSVGNVVGKSATQIVQDDHLVARFQ